MTIPHGSWPSRFGTALHGPEGGGTDGHRIILVAVLAVAFVLRLSGVFWGLPALGEKIYHPDEPKVIAGATAFPADVAARTDLRYPTACHYGLGLVTWPFRAVAESRGHDPFNGVYAVGRILTVLIGTLTVLLLYELALRLYDRRHAQVAAAALAFSMFHVTNSAWATTDVPTSSFFTLFLLLLVPALERVSWRHALGAGCALGLLAGTKYTGAVALVPLAAMTWAAPAPPPTWRELFFPRRFRCLALIVVVGTVVFLLSTPGVVLHFDAFRESLAYESGRLGAGKTSLVSPDTWLYMFAKLRAAVGRPLAVAAVAGLLLALFSRRALEFGLAVLVIAFVGYFRSSLAARYLILVMPALSLFAARALLLPLALQTRWSRLLVVVLTAAVLGQALTYSVFAAMSRYPDSRSEAARFIADEIPPGTAIGVAYTSPRFPFPAHGYRYPDIDFETYRYADFLTGPEYVVVSSYDENKIVRTIRSGVLGDDGELPEDQAFRWYRSSPPSAEIFRFFDHLAVGGDSDYHLVAEFDPPRQWAAVEFAPPRIRIYRRAPAAEPIGGSP